MKPRPKYKALYTSARAQANRYKDERDNIRSEYRRLMVILADEGRRVVADFPSDANGYSVTPLQYECVGAAFDAESAFGSTELEFNGPRSLSFRGKPVTTSDHAGVARPQKG